VALKRLELALSVKAFKVWPTPAILSVFCQNAAVEKISPPNAKI
jgi:hypothetical protein